MAATPQYAATPITAAVKISTANAARDGTGTLGVLVTASTVPVRIDDLFITAQTTTTAGMIRMYLHDGTTGYLLQEIPVAAVTPSATVQSWSNFLPNLGIHLAVGWSLRFSTEKAETFVISTTRAGSF